MSMPFVPPPYLFEPALPSGRRLRPVEEPADDPRETPELEQDASVSEYMAQHLVQVGMRAVIRDLQEYVHERDMTGTINSHELRAYLLAQLIVAGAVDGQS